MIGPEWVLTTTAHDNGHDCIVLLSYLYKALCSLDSISCTLLALKCDLFKHWDKRQQRYVYTAMCTYSTESLVSIYSIHVYVFDNIDNSLCPGIVILFTKKSTLICLVFCNNIHFYHLQIQAASNSNVVAKHIISSLSAWFLLLAFKIKHCFFIFWKKMFKKIID